MDKWWENLVETTKQETDKAEYFKPQPGDNRVRVVAPPLAGYLDWDYTDPSKPKGKPVRTVLSKGKPVPLNKDKDKQPKVFWAIAVYNYATESIAVWEVTQVSILDTLMGYLQDSDFGPLTEYDIKINKTGSNLETKYKVTPGPVKPFDEKITEAISGVSITLEALLENGDPIVQIAKPNF